MSGLMTMDEYREGGWHRRVTLCTECKKELRTSDDWRECKRRHMLEWMWANEPETMRLADLIHGESHGKWGAE